MGQIRGKKAKISACNIRSLSSFGIPYAGMHILVSTDNSATEDGQGNFDAYVVGDGHKAATALPLQRINAALEEEVSQLHQEVKSDESNVQEMAVQLFTGVGTEDITLSPINTYEGQKALSVNDNGKVYLNDVQGVDYYVYVYDIANVESKLNITGSGNWSVAYFAFFTSSLFDAASNVGEVNLAPSGSTTQKKTFYNVDIPSGAQYLLVQELHSGQLIGQKVTKQVAPSQIINGADVYNFIQRKYLRVDAAQTLSSSEKKQGLDNLGIIDSNFYLLEYYGRVAAQMQALSLGTYFFNTYNNTLNQKIAEAGTAGYKNIPIKKDDLCYYLGRFYTSLDGSSLTDIGHGSFHVLDYWGSSGSAMSALELGAYCYNTYSGHIEVKTSDAGTYTSNIIPMCKNDLYYYNGKLYVSLDETTLTDISTIIQSNYIVQETGNNTGKMMSQKAVTDLFTNSFTPVNVKLNDIFFDTNVKDEELTNSDFKTNSYFSSTGALNTNASFDIYVYDIQTITNNLKVVSYTNWGQPVYAFYSSSELSEETLVQIGQSGTAGTELTFTNISIPTGAKYLAVNFHRQYGLTAHAYKLIKVIGNPTVNPLRGKKWACVGDSLTEVNSRTTKHYFDFVAEELGVIPLNYGVSGTGYARHREDNIAFYQRVSSIDLSADIITIFGSFNDLGTISQDFPIGNITDTGTDSVAGCINTTIDNIQARFPLARLGVISPTPWNNVHPSDAGNSTNYVNIIRDICEYRSIPFLDLWRCSNLRPWDTSFREIAYSKDDGNGVHPDENGHSLIAPKFKEFIKNLM